MSRSGSPIQIARKVARKTASVVKKVRTSMAKKGITHTPFGKGVAPSGKRFAGPTPKPQRPRSARWQPGMPSKGRGKLNHKFKASGHIPSKLSGIGKTKNNTPTLATRHAQMDAKKIQSKVKPEMRYRAKALPVAKPLAVAKAIPRFHRVASPVQGGKSLNIGGKLRHYAPGSAGGKATTVKISRHGGIGKLTTFKE